MSDFPRSYYRATGKALDVVLRWENDRDEGQKNAMGLAAEYGSSTPFPSHGGVAGFYCNEGEGPSAEQLAYLKKVDVDVTLNGRPDTLPIFVPDRRKKKGKELARRMDEVYIPSFAHLTSRLTRDPFAYMRVEGNNRVMLYITMERLGKDVILSIPDGGPIPEGAVKMANSEYWLLKESHDPEKGAEAC